MARKLAVSSNSSISTAAGIPMPSPFRFRTPATMASPLEPVNHRDPEGPADHIVVLTVELRNRQVRIRRHRRRTIQRVADGSRELPVIVHLVAAVQVQID